MLKTGLYAITAPELTADLLTACEQALKGGVRLLQYRNKTADAATRFRQCRELLPLCHHYDALLLINDETTLAKAVGADGVHFEWHDPDIAAARELLGADKVIGVSCKGSLQKAQEAVAAGVDYVSFGCVYPSTTLPGAVVVDHDLFRQARSLAVPLVAIGGITRDNALPLRQAGADILAVIHGLFGQQDVESAARDLTGLFED